MGKKTSKTTSTSEPPAWAVGPLKSGMNDIVNTVQGNAGNLSNIESGITGGTIPGLQAQIAQQGQQLMPGYNYLNSTLSPDFLKNGQAQAQALGDYAGQKAGNAVNSSFSMAGRTGSSNNATGLAQGVTQAELAPMLQNLQFNQGLQGQAAGMLPGYSSSQFAGYTPLLGAQQLAGQLPYYGVNALDSLGSLSGNYGTQTSKQPGGWLNSLLGAGASAATTAAMYSDRRLKVNIRKIGEAKDGLCIYEWNWKTAPNGTKETGVIADEVEKLRPWAFARNFRGDGYDGVNYGTLGSLA